MVNKFVQNSEYTCKTIALGCIYKYVQQTKVLSTYHFIHFTDFMLIQLDLFTFTIFLYIWLMITFITFSMEDHEIIQVHNPSLNYLYLTTVVYVIRGHWKNSIYWFWLILKQQSFFFKLIPNYFSLVKIMVDIGVWRILS